MKQLLILALLGCLIMAGCQETNNGREITESPQTKKQEHIGSALPILPQVDVVESANSGEIKNKARFIEFLENTNENKADHIQIIQVTTEGDPIKRGIQFDGSIFISTIDSSRDEYGTGGISETVCTELTTTDAAERIDYQLEGCEDEEERHLLAEWK